MTVVFFGSFLHYSAHVLRALIADERVTVVGVVTTPPHPTGKAKEPQKNPVHQLAEDHSVPVFTPVTLDLKSLDELPSADLFVTAGYGKLLPPFWLAKPTLSSLNLHFSLLPQYRGANPGEWAVLAGEIETGVTLIEMSPQFDTGNILARYPVAISPLETRETLYEKLYVEGGGVLADMIQGYCDLRTGNMVPLSSSLNFSWPPEPQPATSFFYARRLSREDGFIPWETINSVLRGQFAAPLPKLMLEIQEIAPSITVPQFIERASRALAGYPTLWTVVPTAKGETRMKISKCHVEGNHLVLDQVHLAGKNPSRWNEIKNIIQ